MTPIIPSLLYRGDADPHQLRDLKKPILRYQLQTNLLKGGNGHAVFKTPLLELVGIHVHPGWASTHFLSFSEDIITAFRFGLDCEYNEVDSLLNNYEEYYEEGNNWDFAVFSFNSEQIEWNTLDSGIYKGQFESSLLKFNLFPGVFKVILINVKEAIQSYTSLSGYNEIMAKAVKDKEWLLLPATEMQMNTGQIEFSGILDGKCISEISRYKRLTQSR